jgi:Zincin-like metallopeptidase
MQLADFRGLIERMTADIPPQYLEGVVAVEVSPRTVPHPVYPTVYTLGECIPVDVAQDLAPSRVVLYHGSFAALARERPEFDWRAEAWDTLTHELRHHLEQRAHVTDLDAFDWAADQNVRRQEGQPFDPLFFLSGERVAEGIYCVDDDVFWDIAVARRAPPRVEVAWGGRRFAADVPERTLPLFLRLLGLTPPPVGEAFAVIRGRPRLVDLLRRRTAPEFVDVRVRPGG